VGLLLGNGHPDAGGYPLGFLGDEAALVSERQNGMLASVGTVIHSAGAAITTTKGGPFFNKLIKRLSEIW